ncbi:MAG TPA: PDGLE domain-containing protein [Ornithinimicrobium sp.]|uniref:PDGLE domain-containing protein n=1 Tax=Ornithinimicrobium sp. TaxID=1977084 RepID=UPI002B46B921|nr:PDGLE domain-containing protein [Ornithinimicrobium sp.]HKJ13030.1 PDGLE domain-containing protein [Ornithinimicrobium sp.]
MSSVTDTQTRVERRSRRLVVLAVVLVSLVLAVGVSSFASAHPDGLEYVAAQLGFEDTAGDHATAGSPVADYEATGVEDARLSTGLAGLLGVAVTAAVAFALFWALRRRA